MHKRLPSVPPQVACHPLSPTCLMTAALPPRSAADDPPLHGPQLLQRLQELQEAPGDEHFPPGTRVW